MFCAVKGQCLKPLFHWHNISLRRVLQAEFPNPKLPSSLAFCSGHSGVWRLREDHYIWALILTSIGGSWRVLAGEGGNLCKNGLCEAVRGALQTPHIVSGLCD